MKKTFIPILTMLFSVLLIISAWKVFGIMRDYSIGEKTYRELTQYVSVSGPSMNAETEMLSESSPSDGETADSEAANWPTIDFANLRQINSDVVGWILIKGTNINYPIVQGDDNDYYLTHLFDGTVNKSGSIFLDALASPDFSNKHSIVFGHNMKDDTMFSALLGYSDQTFYNEHRDVLIMTPTYNYRIRLFSGYVAENDMNAWDRDIDPDEFGSWIDELVERSVFVSDQNPDGNDKVVTFSTCTEYGQTKFVLHGYIAETESAE